MIKLLRNIDHIDIVLGISGIAVIFTLFGGAFLMAHLYIRNLPSVLITPQAVTSDILEFQFDDADLVIKGE